MNYTEFVKQMQTLRRLRDPRRCFEYLENTLGSHQQLGTTIPSGQSLIRTVPWDNRKGEIGWLSYPPHALSTRGRCNEAGKSVFYSSSNAVAAFCEQKNLRPGQRFGLAEWQTTHDLTATMVGYSKPQFEAHAKTALSDYKEDSGSRHVRKTFQRLFQSRGERSYPQTIGIFDYYMGRGVRKLNGKGLAESALRFMSVEHTNPDALSENIVLQSDVADRVLQIKNCWYVEIAPHEERNLQVNVLDRAIGHADGKIIWRGKAQGVLFLGEIGK